MDLMCFDETHQSDSRTSKSSGAPFLSLAIQEHQSDSTRSMKISQDPIDLRSK
ncbi:hypothetical protein HanIR_Chr16g0819561 [Helianthus annuus]|nr:hypothetical protein HanIR_Chr16g0819561 [Helianthus annuus]